MPSTDRRLELKAKDIDGSDRLTDGCVLIDLASPGVSQTSVYAKGLRKQIKMCDNSVKYLTLLIFGNIKLGM